MADGLSDQKIAEWEETLEPYALDPCVAHWEETLEAATDRTDLDAAEAALEGRPRAASGEDPAGSRRRRRATPAEAGGARGPTARSGARRSGRAPRRAAAPRAARGAPPRLGERRQRRRSAGDLNGTWTRPC
ncbi:cyclin-dependent protein kinase [Aureococcus anophagefferens]|nr:cyclin-dependent protein kinase [Aureococcus anophagefferens]